MKTTTLTIEVQLDDKNIPDKILWKAHDQADPTMQDAKAMLLSFFDRASRDTLKIDLWTKDMQMDEMDRFVYYTLRSLTDTYQRATNNADLAREMLDFVNYFGEKTEILPPAS